MQTYPSVNLLIGINVKMLLNIYPPGFQSGDPQRGRTGNRSGNAGGPRLLGSPDKISNSFSSGLSLLIKGKRKPLPDLCRLCQSCKLQPGEGNTLLKQFPSTQCI